MYRIFPYAITTSSKVRHIVQVACINGLYMAGMFGLAAFGVMLGVLLAFRVMG